MSKRKNIKLTASPKGEDITKSIKRNYSHNFSIDHNFALNDTHQTFLDTALYERTKMCIVDGPAGSAKTFLCTLAALELLIKKRIESIVYIRSVVESASQRIGHLPGEIDDKFKPWSLPLIEKMEELVDKQTCSMLFKDETVKCLPVNFVRGLTFQNSAVIIDEAQNLTKAELTTILTRFGIGSHYFIVGDTTQSDINGKSGFKFVRDAFSNNASENHGIHVFEFQETDIVRSEILKFIIKQLSTQD